MARLPVVPSFTRQALNAFFCILTFIIIFLYFRRWVYLFPITFESVWQISLAEVNRRKNIKRIQQLEHKFSKADEETGIREKEAAVRHLASVVGYREEPNLFRKCLQSYRGSPGLELMLVGIDGDHDGDMEMVRVVEEVIRIFFLHEYLDANVEIRYSPLRLSKYTSKNPTVPSQFALPNPTSIRNSKTRRKSIRGNT
jgi:hyaluronan synthase